MGTCMRATCGCGFKTDKMMLLGRGLYSTSTVNIFPNYCKDCKSIFTANMHDELIFCSHCESPNTVAYNDPYVVKNLDEVAFTSETFKLSKKNSLCPKCSQFSLEFIFVGLWD